MRSLLLVLLIAVLTVKGLDFPGDPGGFVSADENLQWKEMDLIGSDGPQSYIIPDGPKWEENTPLTGIHWPNLEDSEGQIETLLRIQNALNTTTTAQPSGDCESNGGECLKSKKKCKTKISKEFTCINNGVCCIVEDKTTAEASGASEVILQMLSNAVLMQGMALKSMKDNQEKAMINLYNTISTRGLAFQIMKENISDAISNQGIARQFVKSNLSDTISNQGIALQIKQDSIMSNISDGFSNQENILEKMEDNQDTIMSNLTNLGCPEGFFMLAPSNQCFKYFNDVKRNFTEATLKCQSEGLVMAKPNDPIILRAYLLNTYGFRNNEWPQVWIPARGTGSYFQWQPNGGYITSSNPYVYSYSTSYDDSSYCLYMMNTENNMKTLPKYPYYWTKCFNRWLYTLCEMVKE